MGPTEKVQGPNGITYPQKKYGQDLANADDYGANIGQGGLDDWRSTNQELTELAGEALFRHADLDAVDIVLSVKEGVVTLAGHVHSSHEKELAEELVGKIQGVVDVQNNLKIRRSH